MQIVFSQTNDLMYMALYNTDVIVTGFPGDGDQ